MKWPGEALIIHLLEIIERNAITPFTRPLQLRREGMVGIELKREERLAIAEVEAEITRRSSAEQAALLRIAHASAGTMDQAPPAVVGVYSHIAIKSLRREVNVAEAVMRAGDDLIMNGGQVPSETPNPDWLNRWRESASEFSGKEAQDLWGRVLAREVGAPGSFSLRTMEALRTLDMHDAQLIEKLAPLALHGRWIFCSTFSADPSVPGISFAELQGLQQIGIISGVEGGGITATLGDTLKLGDYRRAFVVGDTGIVVQHEDPQAKLQFEGYVTTRIGRELLRLVDPVPNIDYLRRVGLHFKNQGFAVALKKIQSREKEMLSFEDSGEEI